MTLTDQPTLPFDEHAFVKLCATGQVDSLDSLIDTETKYCLSAADCRNYLQKIDTAAGYQSVSDEGQTSPKSDWRFRIARWMLRASDELHLDRTTALIALSYCDRFLMKRDVTRRIYQVVAIASLFVSSKLFEKRPIKMASLINYTQCKFSREELLAMEEDIVNTIGSYLYPPVAGTFVLLFVNKFCVSASIPDVIDSCQFIIELASCDFFFVDHKQSNLAKAALVVAMEQLQSKVPPELIQASNDSETLACLEKLRRLYAENEAQIKAIDGISNNTNAIEDDQSSRKRVARAATPSPVPEDHLPVKQIHASTTTRSPNTDSSNECKRDGYDTDESQRKRQRCEI